MPSSVRSAIDEYLFAKKGQVTAKTYRWYEQKLLKFCAWCEEQTLSLAEIKAPTVRAYLHGLTVSGRKMSDYTRRGYAEVIKGWLSWCASEEEFEDSISAKLAPRIESPKVEKTVKTPFSAAEVHALLLACEREETKTLQVRAKAIVYLLLDTGIRASELACDSSRPEEATGLRLKDVYLDPHDPFIRVIGKGRKERDISLGDKARVSLRKYITRYRGKSQSPYVFLSRTGEPLTVRGLEEFVTRLGERARVDNCFAHRFRHTFAHLFKAKSKDIHLLSEILGHTDTKITENYLQQFSGRHKGFSVADDL